MYFTFNGVSSKDLGLRVKDFTFDTMAQRKVSEFNLENYDGTLYKDYGTFESYGLSIELMLVDNFNIEVIRKIKNTFKNGVGEIIFSHKPNNIYKVRLVNTLNFVEMFKYTGECILDFKVEPFSYLSQGRSYVKVTSGNVLTNLGNYACKPLYKVSGKGSLVITINDKEMKFNSVTKDFIIDVEREDIYNESGENLNNFMDIESDFIGLSEGDNKITFTGNMSLEVMPNWREV